MRSETFFSAQRAEELVSSKDMAHFSCKLFRIQINKVTILFIQSSILMHTSHELLKKALQKAHEALSELNCEDVAVDGFEPYWGYLALTWTPSTQKFLSNLANVCCAAFEKGLKEWNVKGRRHYPPEPHCTIRSFQSKDVPTEIKECIPKEGKVLMSASSIRNALCIHINGVFKHKSDFYNTKYKSICL
jgi:hypothetical protein